MDQNQQSYQLLLTKSVIELERFLLISFVKTLHLLLLLQVIFEISKLLICQFCKLQKYIKMIIYEERHD